MGFHLVEAVYSCVKETSSTEQAILAYLAHRADDENKFPCHPSHNRIAAETHLNISTVKKALVKLRQRNLLVWASGGRKQGGRPWANSYVLNLSESASLPGAPRSPLQGLPRSPCTGSHVAPAPAPTEPPSIIYQPKQPSVIGGAEAEDEKALIGQEGDDWLSQQKPLINARVQEAQEIRQRTHLSLVDEAMLAAGVSDSNNKRIFSSTLMRCYTENKIENAREIIYAFKSELRDGWHKKLRNPASELNKRLALLYNRP